MCCVYHILIFIVEFHRTHYENMYYTLTDNEILDKQLNIIANLIETSEQLTSEIVETILSNISKVVRESEGNIVDQTKPNLNMISNILSNITNKISKDPSLNVSNSTCLKIKISH